MNRKLLKKIVAKTGFALLLAGILLFTVFPFYYALRNRHKLEIPHQPPQSKQLSQRLSCSKTCHLCTSMRLHHVVPRQPMMQRLLLRRCTKFIQNIGLENLSSALSLQAVILFDFFLYFVRVICNTIRCILLETHIDQ